MKLTLLGTGTPSPDPLRRGNSQVVETGDELTLIDAGAGTLHRMVEAGYLRGSLGAAFGGPKLRRILFTHLHSDHCTGLADVLWAGWIQNLWDRPVQIFGPPGTVHFIETLIDAYSYDIKVRTTGSGENLVQEGLMPQVTEVEEGWSIESDHARFSAFRVEHEPVDQAFGFRLDGTEGSMVFSGDTRRSQNLVNHAQDADLLVHEVFASSGLRRLLSDPNTPPARRTRMQFVQSYHTGSDDLRHVATEAGARHLVMSHLVMAGASPADLTADVVATYKGKTTVGEDLMTFELGE